MKRLLPVILACVASAQITPRWPIIGGYTVTTLPTAGVRNRVLVVTDAASISSCLVGGGTTVLLCRDNGTTWAPLGDGQPSGGTTYTATAVIDVASVPDGSCVLDTTAVTVTGAALGGRPTLGASYQPPEGIKIEAKVTGPNSMKLEICNHSGATYNPASATYYFGTAQT